jgi:hypothetical protein
VIAQKVEPQIRQAMANRIGEDRVGGDIRAVYGLSPALA